ncbi:Alpha/Beta hydrolase protein [Multifurca ochricompacta]|uniref:Alpha/Beta hydrolase protein n=1 Tax=Multifurca ochricompacta TaxID=376703 RepID=A0AAD4LWJ7_9AGAM|nr:Alpha/Beta hydrolase protein [Multifurca ochricompacta]
MANKISQHTTFLNKARRVFLILGAIYVFAVALGTVPFVQTQLLYMHNLKIPLFAEYSLPERYDLAPFKTHNVRIYTSDNETLGAWFTLADPFYLSHKADLLTPTSSSSEEFIRSALHTHPTILFLHGNGGTRALRSRVQHYQAFAARLRANVLAPDYRGFGDSTGTPSEVGLTLDARAAWDWLRARGALPENILIVGNSLGTGVAVQFASGLESEGEDGDKRSGEQPRGVVLLAPFSNIDTLLDTYYIMGIVPLLAPLRIFPYIADFVKRFLTHRFDSLAKVVGLNVPLLIVHAEDDWDIPYSHSQTLFDAFLEQHLPPLPELTAAMVGVSDEVAERVTKLSQERAALRRELVTTSEIERVGRVEAFSSKNRSKVVFLHTRWGGHDRVGLMEGVQDYIAEMFNMDRGYIELGKSTEKGSS